MKTLFIVLLSLSLQTAFAQTQQDIDAKEIMDTEAAARLLSAEDMSCKKTTDCAILPLGSRACGGPQGYLVTSKLNAKHSQVAALAQQTVTLEEAFNINYQVFSICSVEMPPTAKCVARQCK